MFQSAEKALRRAALSDPGICDDDSMSATSGATGTVSLGDWGLAADASDPELSPLETALEAMYEKRCVTRCCTATCESRWVHIHGDLAASALQLPGSVCRRIPHHPGVSLRMTNWYGSAPAGGPPVSWAWRHSRASWRAPTASTRCMASEYLAALSCHCKRHASKLWRARLIFIHCASCVRFRYVDSGQTR